MTLSMPRHLVTAVVALVALTACSRGATVGSPSASPASAASAGPRLPAGVTADMIAQGKTLVETPSSNCMRCHGPALKGARGGPDLTDNVWLEIDGSYPAIANVITTGVPVDKIKGNHQNAMRPKGGNATLTDDQIKAMAAYLYSVSHP